MTSSPPPIAPDVIAKKVAELRDAVRATETELQRQRAELEWYEAGQRLFVDPLAPETLNRVDTVRASNGSKPTLREAILTILGESPGQSWKVEDVIAELGRREWLPSGEHAEHHVRSMLAQMYRKGQALRVGRGIYRSRSLAQEMEP